MAELGTLCKNGRAKISNGRIYFYIYFCIYLSGVGGELGLKHYICIMHSEKQ